MTLSCNSQTIKYLMFAFNLFFVISGIIIIAVGAAVKTVYTEYAEFLDTQYFSLPNMLIATGAFIFVVSFFGCCGAVKENWIMLAIFSVFLCIIFIFEFASGIAGYVLRDQTAAYLDATLTRNLDTYNSTSEIWDLIQSSFSCCGVDSYKDWENRFDDYGLPISCCSSVNGTVGAFYCNSFNSTSPVSPTTTTQTSTEPSSTESSSSATTSSVETTTANLSTPGNITVTVPTTTATSTTPGNPTDSSSSSEVTTATVPTTGPTSPVSTTGSRRKRALLDPNEADATTIRAPVTPLGPTTTLPYQTGCKDAFGDYIKKHAVQIGGCALGLAIIQILGIIFSCHLVRQLKNGYYST